MTIDDGRPGRLGDVEREILRFGDCVVDVGRRIVHRGDSVVELQPRRFDIIVFLIRQRDRVVSRDELLATLWPDEFVSDASLAFCIKGARAALGDDGSQQKYIRTHKGKGYRFIAEVQVDGPEAALAAGENGQAAPPTLLGRERELVRIRQLLAETRSQGGCRCVILSGEAGIGKTTLLDVATKAAAADGFRILSTRCHEDTGAPAFWPWLQVLRAIDSAGAGAGRGDEMSAGQLIECVAPAIRPHSSEHVARPDVDRYLFFDAMRGLLAQQARHGPIVLAFDDIQWADEASVRLFHTLIRETRSDPILFLATLRQAAGSANEDADFAAISMESCCTEIALGGLSTGALCDLARQWFSDQIPPKLIDEVALLSSANPLFFREILQHLTDGKLVEEWQASGRPVTEIQQGAVPGRIIELLRHRLRRLPSECRRVLAIAAVLGPEFSTALLVRSAVGVERGIDSETVLRQLDLATEAGVLEERAGDQRSLHFVHPLFREALSRDLQKGERQDIHAAIVRTLEESAESDRAPLTAQLAYHSFQAARSPKSLAAAISYSTEAARRSFDALAYEDAAVHNQRALALLDELAEAAPADRFSIRMALGRAHEKCGHVRRSRQAFLDAADTARRLGDAEGLAAAALGFGAMPDMPGRVESTLNTALEEALAALPEERLALRAECMARLAWGLYFNSGTRVRRNELSRDAVALARNCSDLDTLARTLLYRRQAIWAPDTLAERLRIGEEMLQIAERKDDDELCATALGWHIPDLVEGGHGFAADAAIDRLARLARRLKQPWIQWQVEVQRASREMRIGNLDEALRLCGIALDVGLPIQPEIAMLTYGAQSSAIAFLRGSMDEIVPLTQEAVRQNPNIPAMRVLSASVRAETGDTAEARSLLADLSACRFTNIPWDNNWIVTMAMLSRLVSLLLDREAAAILYDLLLPFERQCVVVGPSIATLGSVSVSLGGLASVCGRWDEADGHFRNARAAHEQLGSKLSNVHVDLLEGLSLMYRPRPKTRQARRLFSRAREQATAMGMKGIVLGFASHP